MSAARLASAAIKIPKRIERGPTDILKALASTVKPVPQFTHPYLLDDPYLAPPKVEIQRDYLLARLHGIRTARYIFNKKPELFTRDDSEPKIESFQPIEEFRADMEFSEQDLVWCIENKDVLNGIIAYEALEERGIKVNDEILMRFLELLCFTNGENFKCPNDNDITLLINDYERDISWLDNGTADKIFEKAKGKLDPPRVYSTMMAGLNRHSSIERVRNLFEEFKTLYPDKPLTVEGYKALIDAAKSSESKSSCMEAVEQVVQHMATNLVTPDRRIFNSILACHLRFNVDEEVCTESLKLLNDMRALKIEPSLSTFYTLISILLKPKNFRTYQQTIANILDYLNSVNLDSHIKDRNCVDFFYILMNRITERIQDLRLGKSIHKLMLKKPGLFRNLHRRNRYFDRYFKLIIQTENLKNILGFYHQNVPINFTPLGDTYDMLAEVLDLYHASDEEVKYIGNHIVEFRLLKYVKNNDIFKRDPLYVQALESLVDEKAGSKRSNSRSKRRQSPDEQLA